MNRKSALIFFALVAMAIVSPILIVSCEPRHAGAAQTDYRIEQDATALAPAQRLTFAPTPPRCPAGSMVVVVGDSITEQAAPYLRPMLQAAGYDAQINARGGRTIVAGQEVVWGYGEEIGPLRCWVIALGTNDTFVGNPANYQMDILRLLAFIPSGGEPVWWVPVAVAGGAAINALVPVTNPLVPATLVGWQPGPVDLLPDGVHLSAGGRHRWAETVLAAVTS